MSKKSKTRIATARMRADLLSNDNELSSCALMPIARQRLDKVVGDSSFRQNFHLMREEIDKLKDDNTLLKKQLHKKTRSMQMLEKDLMKYKTRCNDLQSQFNQLQEKCNKRKQELEKELEQKKELLDDAHKEEAMLQKIIEQNIKEEQNVKDEICQQDEIFEIDDRYIKPYNAILEQSLQELHNQCEAQLWVYWKEIEFLYEDKIRTNLAPYIQSNSEAAIAVTKMKQICFRIETLNSEFNNFKVIYNSVNACIRDLENLEENKPACNMKSLASLLAEFDKIEKNMSFVSIKDIHLKIVMYVIRETVSKWQQKE